MTDEAIVINHELLARQDADTSNAVISRFSSDPDFLSLSEREGSAILGRDEEDAEKLKKGIDFAKEKGVIDVNFVPEQYISIDVLGKTPEAVCDLIQDRVEQERNRNKMGCFSKLLGGGGKANGGGAKEGGSVIVLCGLSGTGKGTTVSCLKRRLESDGSGRTVVTWSNGNIFRSVTLLAATWCEQQDGIEGFDADKALTNENLAKFISMLSFGKFGPGGSYDTRIQGLGLDLLVSQVQNTDLKSPKVSKNIPTVAQVTQGEVILFAAGAVKQMGESGMVVLLEGREQTVDYVRTPLRFILTLSDPSLIGKRRAAQRIMASAVKDVTATASADLIGKALEGRMMEMAKEGN